MRADLGSALDFGRGLREIYRTTADWKTVDLHATAALVRYCRTFAGGVRNPQLGSDALASLTKDQREKHDRLQAIRDKHVAHSVNSFEESQPVARYCVERVREEGVTSVDCNHSEIVGLGYEDVSDIIELCTRLLTYVDERLREEKARLLPIVRALPIEQVLAGEQYNGITADNPDRRRRRPTSTRRTRRRP